MGDKSNRCRDKTSRVSMSAIMSTLDTSAFSLGDVVVSGKGARQIPLLFGDGESVITWCPRDAMQVLFEPSAFNDPSASRVNLCLSASPAIAQCLHDFHEWLVNTVALESKRLFGVALSVEDVRARMQPMLRTHEASGSQSLRVKLSLAGRSRVRLWDTAKNPISPPASWTHCTAKLKIRLKAIWLMGKSDMGVLCEASDIMLDEADVQCPF